MSSGGGAARK
ncbi:hypothetical protein A2U01_0102673, partial [Trifolium medium]|nr:hypothetical protein [Trifolium medium]